MEAIKVLLVQVFRILEIVEVSVEIYKGTTEDRCQVVIQAEDLIQKMIAIIAQDITMQMRTLAMYAHDGEMTLFVANMVVIYGQIAMTISEARIFVHRTTIATKTDIPIMDAQIIEVIMDAITDKDMPQDRPKDKVNAMLVLIINNNNKIPALPDECRAKDTIPLGVKFQLHRLHPMHKCILPMVNR
jgi:hypothetical protein